MILQCLHTSVAPIILIENVSQCPTYVMSKDDTDTYDYIKLCYFLKNLFIIVSMIININ